MDSTPITTRILNPALHERTKWDWACLGGCFGDTRITPSDVDAIVERHGYFLVLETKLPGVEIPTGQRILLEALSLNPRTLVLFVWGRCPAVEEMAALKGGKYIRDRRSATLEDLRRVVEWWWRKANGGPNA